MVWDRMGATIGCYFEQDLLHFVDFLGGRKSHMKPAINILHVEDDPADALLVQEILMEEAGGTAHYNVVHVDNLKEALKTLHCEGFNAVMLDLGLKDISGVDNVRMLKEENPDIPIIVLTGFNNEDTALQAIKQGAQEYIVKGYSNGNVLRLAIKSSIERKAYERKLFQQANFDELTGLANRRLFKEYLEKALMKAKRFERQEVLMFLDLDRFKDINDTYGHEAGNMLLMLVAERIKQKLRESDMIARYGGDEFIILLGNNDPKNMRQGCVAVAEKILDVIREPYDLGGNNVSLSTSIGIAIYPDSGETPEALLETADHAMYEAKRSGMNQYVFA